MDHSQRNGALFILLSVTGYSLIPIWVKNIQATGLDSLHIAFWRFAFAVPLFWLLIVTRRLPLPGKPLPRGALALSGTLIGLSAITGFWGLERLPAGTFVVLFYSYPAMVAIISLFLGEKLSAQGWLALALTTVGVILTVPDFGVGLSGENLIGVLMALVNALGVAVYFIISSRLLRGHNAMARASAWVLTGALAVFAVAAPFQGVGSPSPRAWVFLLGLAAASTVFTIFFLNAGIQQIGPARAAIMGTIEPILTAALAAVFLGERMGQAQLLGGAFIVASIILLQLGREVGKPKTVTDSL
jgi:drug/metabolite transporter (DMT)-like permease